MKNFFQKTRNSSVLAMAVLGIVMFFVYAFIPLTIPTVDNSPDEMSNRFFAELFEERSRLWSLLPLNAILDDEIVHPRSMRVVDDYIVPGGFIGLPVLYGAAAKFFGSASIAFMTPLIAVIAAFAWGAMLTTWFDRRVGVIATVLLLVQPAWWYTASRTLMPNILLMSLLILALYFFFGAPLRKFIHENMSERLQYILGEKRLLDAAFAGVFLGLALAVRLSAAYWIVLVVMTVILCNLKRIPWVRLIVCIVMLWVTLAPFLILNNVLYGGILSTGYGAGLGTEVEGAVSGGRGAQLLGSLQPYLFPLGFSPRVALDQFYTYGIAFFWWWSVLVGLSIGWMTYCVARLRQKKEHVFARLLHAMKNRLPFAKGEESVNHTLIAVTVVLALWLIPFYGSWIINDNPDPNAITIGASHIRYWLPLFILSTIPVALALRAIAEMTKKHYVMAVVGMLAVIGFGSGAHVFHAEQEGLLAMQQNLERFAGERDEIMLLTESTSVIIVDNADKIIYPHRNVIYPLRSDRTYESLPKLRMLADIYYFGITFPEGDLQWLQNEKLPQYGLTLRPLKTFGEQTLYRFYVLTSSHE